MTLLVLCSPAFADEDLRLPRVLAASGGPYVIRNSTIEKFNDNIVIPEEYWRAPLSLVCTNGSDTEPGFAWVRMFLLPDEQDQDLQPLAQPVGRLLVNEDSFLASARIYLDMSGQLKRGRNRIFIEGAGRVGAVYSWEIRTIGKPDLYMPATASTISGAWLNISGAGFSLRPDENTVQVGMYKLPVAESNSNNLKVFIPRGMPAGTYPMAVSIRNFQSRTVQL
ncbi:MAG: IPT/TIG domain-containing protein, partial [Candidatus Obscuribacterales bacterium]|nr:IPT/TIG domain-containing protein [Candidatus Obscuribacterales bacterium]